MKLPNAEQAVVQQAKITEYLLSDTHPSGQEKAAFFTQFGFTRELWEDFAQALIQHASYQIRLNRHQTLCWARG